MLVTNIRVDHEEAVMVIERWRRICKNTWTEDMDQYHKALYGDNPGSEVILKRFGPD